MKLRIIWLLACLAPLLILGGCETAGKKTSKVQPQSVPALPPPVQAPAPVPEPVAQKPVEPPAPKPDPVATILADSGEAYQAGVDAYKAGHLERAKREFDRAVDLLLSSPAELREDGRVDREFEKLVDQIHRYEVVALKEGDGFTERHSVPAAVDEIAELTFPADAKLKEKVEQEVKDTASDLPLVTNDYVLGYINYFTTRGRATIETALRRAGRYRPMISRVLAEEGVPQELIYLAQAESAFQPWALSRAGARGMWQFMASRAREYDLNVNWWVDDRQDPEKATRAAARHLKDLHDMFGDWYLAMAAYNSGPGGVQRAVERTGYADFWELYRRNALPRETRNYVPIILAATIVGKNPEKYGFDGVLPDPAIATEAVTISSPTDMRLIAETIDVSVTFIRDLNPSLLRMITPNNAFELRLPAGTKDRFLQQIALIPEDKRVLWRWHTVAPGEGLNDIAGKYRTTAEAITEVNGLQSANLLEGTKLVIPVANAREESGVRVVRLRYRVRKGDTIGRVADRFGVTPSQVRAWNRVRGNQLSPGRILVIHTAVTAPVGSLAQKRTSRKSSPPSQTASKSQRNKRIATGKKSGAELATAGSPRPAAP